MSDTSITLSKLITPEDVRKAGWATEKTLNKLLEAMSGEKSTPAPLSQAEKEAAENARLAREESKKNRSVMGMLSDSVAGTKKAFAGTGEALENAIKRGFGSPSDMLSTFGGTVAQVGKNLQSETGALKSFGIVLGYLSVAVYDVSLALGKMIQTNNVFLGVYDSGVRLEGGLQGLMIASQGAGMDVAEFGSLLSKHSTTVAMLGSTRTPALIKNFQDLTHRGSDLMMTQGQANEAFMQTTEILQQTGAMSGMSLENLGKSSRILLVETNLLSKETGQSRKSILDFVSSVTKSGSSYLLLSTMGKGAGENFAYAAVQATRFGQTFGKTLTDNMQKFMAGNGSLGLLDENFRMLANLVPGASDAFADLNKATAAGDKDGIKNATERFGKALADTPEPLKKQLLIAMPEIAEILGDASKNQALIDKKKEEDAKADAAEAKKLNLDLSIVTQRRIDRENKEETDNKERQRQLNEVDAATKNLSTEFTRFYVSMAQFVIPVLDNFAKSINYVIEKFQGMGAWIGKTVFGQDQKEADVTGGVSGLAGAAAMAFGSWGGAKLLGKGYRMAKGMASTALGMGEDIPLPGASGPPSPGGRPRGAGGAGGGPPPGSGRPGSPRPGSPPASGSGGGGIIGNLFEGLGKLGPMLSSIGKGAGDAIKGILTGIGQGLSELGKTSVLKGVVALGGISASMWVAAKAFQEFNKVEWGSLAKAAVAITGIGAAAYAVGQKSSEIIKGGTALGIAVGAIGLGLMAAGTGLQMMEGISWETLITAGSAIGIFGGAALLANQNKGGIIGGGLALGVAIGAIGLAMMAAGTALQMMEGISWETVGKAGVAILALGAASALVGLTGVGPLAVAAGGLALGVAIGAIGLAMQKAGAGFKIIEEISWDSLGKAGVAIGALSVIAAAAGVVSPLIALGGMALGKAIGAIGIGMMMAGSGLKMMESVSWGSMAKAGVAINALGVAAAAAGLISPLIVSGGEALGKAMKFIGEGLGMVADTLAMSLENIAGSIQQFANIDGNSLVDTGKGMLALAGGLTVMSAGSLIGSLANFADGMLNFFREDPITKLKRFAEVGEPLRIAAESMDLLATSMPRVLDTIGTLNNVDFSGTRQLKDAFSQMPSGGVIRGLTTNVNQYMGTQGGAGINKMPDFEDRDKEVAGSMSTGINQDNLSSLQMLQNTLSGNRGMSTLYSNVGKSMMEFGTGYKETVNALNMPISQESLSNFQSLTDILMGKSPSSSMGQESGFNFAESTASYYDNSQSYYNSTLVLFRDMRDSSMQMSQDIASIKNLTDTMMRRMAFESPGSAETAR